MYILTKVRSSFAVNSSSLNLLTLSLVSLSVKNISGVTCQLCLKGDLVKFNEGLFPCNPGI